jgi:hypothetical protein
MDVRTAKTMMKAIGLYFVKNTLQLSYDDDCKSLKRIFTDLIRKPL